MKRWWIWGVVQGEYIKQLDEYEYNGFECAVRMRKEA